MAYKMRLILQGRLRSRTLGGRFVRPCSYVKNSRYGRFSIGNMSHFILVDKKKIKIKV